MKETLRNSALIKVLMLLALTLLLCIPLLQIGWLIDERGGSQQQAARELAASHAGPQTGPQMLPVNTVRRRAASV